VGSKRTAEAANVVNIRTDSIILVKDVSGEGQVCKSIIIDSAAFFVVEGTEKAIPVKCASLYIQSTTVVNSAAVLTSAIIAENARFQGDCAVVSVYCAAAAVRHMSPREMHAVNDYIPSVDIHNLVRVLTRYRNAVAVDGDVFFDVKGGVKLNGSYSGADGDCAIVVYIINRIPETAWGVVVGIGVHDDVLRHSRSCREKK
jgi:hypothetical protein